MDNHIIKLAQIIQQNAFTGSNHGLMNGNTGISIFFYHLTRKTDNPDYEKIADGLLDKAFANLSLLAPVDFENGLAGIGWGIEYLVQNNFAEGNTDEILEEVDNKVFRALNEDSHTSFELTTGLTGYLFYLINRLKNINTPISIAQHINRELLILTINKIDQMVPAQFPSIVKDINFDLFWRFPAILFGLHNAFKLNIYNEKIICMVRQWLPYFETYLPSLHINRLFLAVVMKQITSQIPDKRLEKQIQILLFATDFEVLKTEVDHNIINIRIGWPGVAWLLNVASKELTPDLPNYQFITQTYYSIIDRHSDQLEKRQQSIPVETSIQYGPGLGLTGIGLMELLWPGIISGN